MHYGYGNGTWTWHGCPSGNGIKAQVSMDLFLIELELGWVHDTSTSPLWWIISTILISWVTPSWEKSISIWEKVDNYGYKYKVVLKIEYISTTSSSSQEWVTNGSCVSLKISSILHKKNYGSWAELACTNTNKCCSCQIYFVSRARRLIQSVQEKAVGRMKNGLSLNSPLRNHRLRISRSRSGNQYSLSIKLLACKSVIIINFSVADLLLLCHAE